MEIQLRRSWICASHLPENKAFDLEFEPFAKVRVVRTSESGINDCSRREFVRRAPVADRKRTNSRRKPVFLDSESEVSLFRDQSRMAARIARRTWISADSPNNPCATRRQRFLDWDFLCARGAPPEMRPLLYAKNRSQFKTPLNFKLTHYHQFWTVDKTTDIP